MLALVSSTVKTRDHWIPRLRLNKMSCERCGLMAHAATWTTSGDGDSRYAWLHILCDHHFQHADWNVLHLMKIEGYEQRRAAARRQEHPKLGKVVGL